jgi:hypothetical protein
MNCVPQVLQGGLVEGFGQGRMNMNRAGNVFGNGAHLERVDELAGQLRDMRPDRLNAHQLAIVPAREHADEPGSFVQISST